MVYYKNRFISHLDLLNQLTFNQGWSDASCIERRKLFSIWNLPGFVGTNLATYLAEYNIKTFIINNFDAEWDLFVKNIIIAI